MNSTNTTKTTEPTESPTTRHFRGRHFWLLLALPILLSAGFWAVQANAAGNGFGFGPPLFGNGDSPEQHKAFMARRLEKMLDVVAANDSQRTAIKAIAERALAEMQPIHEQHQHLRKAMVTAFTSDTVDPAAVERLRLQATALMDRGSQVFSRALLDAAQALTPDQRQILAKFIQEHHGRRRHF